MSGTVVGTFEMMLVNMRRIAVWLLASDRASYQVWGQHLLEDWKSLSLLAEGLECDLPEHGPDCPLEAP